MNLRHLKLLIDKTKADIVLTSDWRFDPEAVEHLNEKLSEYGLTVSDKTPGSGDYEHRGKEIDDWLRQHPGVCSFAVIDDLYFPDFEEYELSNRLVKTDDKYGLRIEDVEKSIHILTGI